MMARYRLFLLVFILLSSGFAGYNPFMPRAFIAISLDGPLLQTCASILRKNKEQDPTSIVRWVNSAQLHITLQFLGEQSLPSLLRLRQPLEHVIGQVFAFPISLGEIGQFPKRGAAKVFYLDVASDGNLEKLAALVRGQVLAAGLLVDTKPFTSHITLGRVPYRVQADELAQISACLAQSAQAKADSAEMLVKSVTMFLSELAPSGARHSPYYTMPLRYTAKPQVNNQ